MAEDIGNDTQKLSAIGVSSIGQAGDALRAAQASYDAALARLAQLQAGPQAADIQGAQAAVDSAKAALMAAEYRVDQMKRGSSPEELAQAQSGVDSAQAGLSSAEARLAQVRGGATEEELRQVDAAVAQAQGALGLVASPYTEHDLAQAQNAVAIAEQAYSLAADPYTRSDLELARASVAQAQASLEMAQAGLSESVIVSPMDGVVADRPVSVGSMVSPGSAVASIISEQVELVLGVEESQVGAIRVGQGAQVRVASYPDTVFGARVALIAPAADPKSRTFQVRVRPEEADGRLRPGDVRPGEHRDRAARRGANGAEGGGLEPVGAECDLRGQGWTGPGKAGGAGPWLGWDGGGGKRPG